MNECCAQWAFSNIFLLFVGRESALGSKPQEREKKSQDFRDYIEGTPLINRVSFRAEFFSPFSFARSIYTLKQLCLIEIFLPMDSVWGVEVCPWVCIFPFFKLEWIDRRRWRRRKRGRRKKLKRGLSHIFFFFLLSPHFNQFLGRKNMSTSREMDLLRSNPLFLLSVNAITHAHD